MASAEVEQQAGELGEVAAFLPDPGPVDPRDLVVLAIGVVVAALGSADLVACQQHGGALGKQQRGQEVAALACAKGEDVGGVRGTFDAVIPTVVAGVAVAVALAVGLVVLVIVRDQIVQREAVMGGDEIDAGPGAASVALEQV